MRHLTIPLALSLWALAAACGSEPQATDVVRWIEVEGAAQDPDREGGLLVDFGEVPVGARRAHVLTVRNPGLRPVWLERVAVGAPFEAEPAEARQVPGRGAVALELGFGPEALGPFEGETAIVTSFRTIPVRLVGRGRVAAVECAPGAIDFLSLLVGEQKTRSIGCVNRTGRHVELEIGAPAGDAAAAFRIEGATLLQMEPDEAVEFGVTWEPQEGGIQRATVQLALTDGTRLQQVQLLGMAVDGALTWAPQGGCLFPIPTPVGDTHEARVNFLNREPRKHHVTSVELPAGYMVPRGIPMEIPADEPDDRAWSGFAFLPIRFTPTAPGPWSGVARIHTTDPRNPVIEVCLSGFGGGPDLVCGIDELDFGEVAMGVPVTRSYWCENRASWHEDLDASRLQVFSLGASHNSFHVQLRDRDRRSFAPGERFFIDVTASAVEEGVNYGSVVMLTNDSADIDERILLRATGVPLPPCAYELEPPAVDFGSVEPGTSAERALQVRNTGAHACLVHGVALAAGADPAFTLLQPPAGGTRIEPGEALPIRVGYAPAAEGPAAAASLRLELSEPMRPVVEVPVRAVPTTRCLALSAPALDFGVVAPGCRAEAPLRLLNRCELPVVLGGVETGSGFDVAAPTLPASIAAGEGIALWLGFAPGADGAYRSELVIHADGTEPYRVPLDGNGSPEPQVDRWAPGERRQVDLLWLSDGRVQPEGFAPFVEALASWDFHVAVASACAGEEGRLLPLAEEEPVLVAGDDEVASRLEAGLAAGCAGGLRAAAHAALVPPLRNQTRFFRPEAELAVFFLTDGEAGAGPDAAAFAALKPGAVDVHAAVGCAGSPGVESLVAAFGGTVHDTCLAPGEAPGALAAALRERLGHFPLRGVPADRDGDGVLSPLELQVLVDDAPAAPAHWHFEPATRAIHFAPGREPDRAAAVEVRYWPACGG